MHHIQQHTKYILHIALTHFIRVMYENVRESYLLFVLVVLIVVLVVDVVDDGFITLAIICREADPYAFQAVQIYTTFVPMFNKVTVGLVILDPSGPVHV